MVRLEDAEEYELAVRGSDELDRPSRPGSSRPADEHEAEHERLLATDEPKASTELDDDEGFRRTRVLDEQEIVGKGGKIEALIARVSSDSEDHQGVVEVAPAHGRVRVLTSAVGAVH